jgi:lauroyl/myristoyl acyltransferase/acyl carrier protein
VPGVSVAVVDDGGQSVPERQVGEIIIGGDSLFSGYFGDPERTVRALRAGWFSTGDLGYLADGELYICDRKQDLIIVGGRNIFPESIEAIARATLGEQARHVVTFGVTDEVLGTETPVLVCATRPGVAAEQQEALAQQLHLSVSQSLGVALGDIYFAPRDWIVRTTSGKLARAACRAKYLAEGRQPAVLAAARLSPALRDTPDQLQAALLALASQMLGVATVQPNDNFFELGGDSLTAMRFILAVEEALARNVPMEFFQEPTVCHLVHLLIDDQRLLPERQFSASAPPPAQPVSQQPVHSWRRRLFALPQRMRVRGRAMLEAPAFRRPYFAGLRWLMGWCGRPWVQALFYPQERQWVRRLAESVGTPPAQVSLEIQLSLVAHSIHMKRKTGAASGEYAPLVRELLEAATSPPLCSEAWSRYFDLRGAVHLEEALQQNCGIICVGNHLPTSFVSRMFLDRRFEHHQMMANAVYRRAWQDLLADQGISYVEGQKAARSAVALAAAHTLAQGGVVGMAGDREDAQAGLPVVIGDRRHHLVYGFAELAISTGAAILPFYTRLLPEGRIQIHILAPLRWNQESNRETQAREIMAQYAAVQTQLWRQSPGMLLHGVIRRHLPAHWPPN